MNKTPPDVAMKRLSRQIDEAFEEVARLSGKNLPPTDFYQEFLSRVLAGVEAQAGAVWIRTPQGFLQLQTQINLDKIGLDTIRQARQHHNELLRVAFQGKKELMVEPHSSITLGEGQKVENKTEYLLLLAPILIDDKTAVGLLEICQEVAWDARVHPTYLNYAIQMAGYASNYQRQIQARQSNTQEQVWAQLEAFSRSIHSSLNPTEVAYQIANDGRRLVGCDRISVAVRHKKAKSTIEAVSGADVVEKASNAVQVMRRLFDAVIDWNEKLVYRGEKDETLPPKVLQALDDHLAESNAKLLVVQPMRDEREKPTKDKPTVKPVRSALMLECYETPADVEPMIARLDVVCNHAAPALYNAAEMKRIPMRMLWMPLAKLQEGLGGKARFWTLFISALLIAITAAMILVPYPLKLDANGQLVPSERTYIYSTRPGRIEQFKVAPGDVVVPDAPLVTMFDSELQMKLDSLKKEIDMVGRTINFLTNQMTVPNSDPVQQKRLEKELASERVKLGALGSELAKMEAIHNCDRRNSGYFAVVAPKFAPNRLAAGDAPRWTILSADFRENLTGKTVNPTDPVLRLGNKYGPWEIELKIPQKHIGQALRAFSTNDPNEYLDVDLIVTSVPTATYRGRLYRKYIGGEAVPNRDDHNESEPIVYAYVRINEPDMPDAEKIPADLLVTGVEVHTKIRCGDHAMGYSLFYGLWEFLYRNVVFFF
ncbi:efflux RND transporter periplasmic adaptor subunit [Tuwongella immobilis]|uniref:Secretion protein HlyD family protein n=1 Tax=Tuwongella immobilis TaxID=692036 RepID=A0A6C2YWI2_9BACT|nr:hypothetical protein [Tuwongella immobilis]VIP05751.1 Secretion protein HlyD family protein OS=Isosphaera pallida (strain ATCC 43644 / DSM 9630 / IS1B) GN=Isop_2160 PE=4 SV=1 [Tuwongella immobilis]VTS08858.1 Secretion protein HlyD family protein OS=Isosphaera pallida (strain ATCC 43644 / DSM 9630 / IS1B) GN=Isop_2160 PE=4 SV=1 [Tuwongella immobilis]